MTFPSHTLDSGLLPQVVAAIETISIHPEAMGAPEMTPEGVQRMWRCSDEKGQLFVLRATDLGPENALGVAEGTIYLEAWPREKGAPKRKSKEVSSALTRLEELLARLGATKCA